MKRGRVSICVPALARARSRGRRILENSHIFGVEHRAAFNRDNHRLAALDRGRASAIPVGVGLINSAAFGSLATVWPRRSIINAVCTRNGAGVRDKRASRVGVMVAARRASSWRRSSAAGAAREGRGHGPKLSATGAPVCQKSVVSQFEIAISELGRPVKFENGNRPNNGADHSREQSPRSQR